MSHVAFVVGLLAVLLPATAEPAAQPTPAGLISGRVLNDAGRQPLAGTRVFLYAVPFPDGGRPAMSITNEDGEYAFDRLAPGSYRVGLNKLGFFPTPGGGSGLIHIVEAGAVGNIDLAMTRGGVLSGRVMDQGGLPSPGIFVAAMRVDGIARIDQVVPAPHTARTTKAGEFRVEGLPPGGYVVVANWTSSGRTDSMTYFPGTPDISGAQLVDVGAAEIVVGCDFQLGTWPLFEVSGLVVDKTRRPVAGALVTLYAPWPKFGGPMGSITTDAGGRFRIGQIMRGDYRLTAGAPDAAPTLVTSKIPFVPVTVVDADVEVTLAFPIR